MAAARVVCVLGGLGHLGTQLVRCLLLQHRELHVRVFDRLCDSEPTRARLWSGFQDHELAACKARTEFQQGDVTRQEDVTKACAGCCAVFHTVSIVDLAPCPSSTVFDVNLGGTENVVRACTQAGVPSLVYTSSIDVVFTGAAVLDGVETLPYPRVFYNGYIQSKAAAEQLVLSSNSQTLRTCSLRPGHIYGPHDPMITIMLNTRRQGHMPFAFSTKRESINSYVFVDNCADAHVRAWEALDKGKGDSAVDVAGRSFFLVDHNANVFDHMEPFFHAAGLTKPSWTVPFPMLYCLALFVECMCWLLAAALCIGHRTSRVTL